MLQLQKQTQFNIKQNIQNYLNWIQNLSQKATININIFSIHSHEIVASKGKEDQL